MDQRKLGNILDDAILEGVFPGAAYAIGRGDRHLRGAHGRYTYCEESPQVRQDTLWDLASVSKVVGTTTAAMLLVDDGKLDLKAPVADIVPEFGVEGKASITVHNLLVHDSGLIAFRPYHRTHEKPDTVREAIYAEKLQYPTGTQTVYSDLNMVLVQDVIERLSGEPLQALLDRRVFGPLGMKDTGYNPGIGNPRCAPTEGVEPWRLSLRRRRLGDSAVKRHAATVVHAAPHPDASHWIQGEVHDPTATVLGGIAGHAGLFSTTADLTRFVRMMLAGGEGLIRPETIARFTKPQSTASTRGLGWDTKSPRGSSAGSKFGSRSFGHTGYTGTSVWADPDSGTYCILLTNRVHPTSENTRIIAFRPVFHDAAWDVLTPSR